MKKIILPVLSFFLLISPALIRADDAKPTADKPKVEKPKHVETELEKSMEVIGKSWRKVRKQVADATLNASTLELVGTIQAAMKQALPLTPDLARDIPAEKREQYVAAYREKMKETLAVVDQLAAALTANDNKLAGEIIAKIGSLQKEGHKEYKRPE